MVSQPFLAAVQQSDQVVVDSPVAAFVDALTLVFLFVVLVVEVYCPFVVALPSVVRLFDLVHLLTEGLQSVVHLFDSIHLQIVDPPSVVHLQIEDLPLVAQQVPPLFLEHPFGDVHPAVGQELHPSD